MKKYLISLEHNTHSRKVQKLMQEKIATLDKLDAHRRRSRCKFKGEMIQMDASEYMWMRGVLWHLHVAIDDASGEIVGAYFDTQETLCGYYHVFYQILNNHGIPCMFYTDRRTVFEYKRKKHLT
ncbi:MAG: hypothetical protein ACK5KR_06640 [Breznakia sp.]